MDIAIAKSEYRRIGVFIGALLLGSIIMFINLFLVKSTSFLFTNEYTRYLIFAGFISFLLYEAISYLIARRYLEKKVILPDNMKVINVIIEATFPSILLFMLYGAVGYIP